MSMLEHALTWWNLGYAPLPIRPNGTKAPACRWRDFLEARPTRAELDKLTVRSARSRSMRSNSRCSLASGQS